MANEEHLAQLQHGVAAWNQWEEVNRDIRPDLRGAHLRGAHLSKTILTGADLTEADLTRATLTGADLTGADLFQADLTGADLTGATLFQASLFRADLTRADLTGADLTGATLFQASLFRADLTRADLTGADLREADLTGATLTGATLTGADLSRATLFQADLFRADLTGATLREADLTGATLTEATLSRANLGSATLEQALLIQTNLEEANLTGCTVYGTSIWEVQLNDKTEQKSLIISKSGDPSITVDNIEVAQFIYLLLNNQKIRDVIDTITSKMVLILGRFTAERKQVLDAIREELRHCNYLPVLFDFEKPASRDFTETISTLAHMARFIIADITEAKSLPQELQSIVPDLPSVPVQPLLQISADEYGMFEHFTRFPWVLETYRYKSLEEVIASLTEKVIAPAEFKAKELLGLMER